MIILCPSRGRPDRFADMRRSAYATAAGAVDVVAIVDSDDPTLPGYGQQGDLRLVVEPGGGFVAAANAGALVFGDHHDVLGVFGDDVLFRTRGWDERVRETLATPGIAYGDDQVHGEGHPTGIVMSSVIAKALGWIALPSIHHQWADDVWKRLGQELGLLRYMPDVVIEHMHPAVGKAAMDATYEAIFGANEAASVQAASDHAAFQEWLTTWMAGDVAAVRQALTP